MNNFKLMYNDLINSVESNSVATRPLIPNLSNTMKLTRRVKPTFIGPSTIYNQRLLFQVPREPNGLAQIFIKCTLTCDAEALPKTQLGTRIFDKITIKTRKGTILQNIDKLYTLTRIDELDGSPISSYIQNCIDPDDVFDTNTVSLFVPLFAFFSESSTGFLPTAVLEPLEIECVVNDSKESMGLQEDLTATEYEMHFIYHDKPKEKFIRDDTGFEPYYSEPLPKELHHSFDVFYEDITTIATGATSARVLIRNPNPSYVMHMALVNPATQAMEQIRTFKLVMAGEEVVDMDFRSNFTLYNPEMSITDDSTVSYWFCKEKKRTHSSGLLYFSDAFYPTYLELTFDSLVADYELHVFFEHKTQIHVTKDGELNRQAIGVLKRT